MWFAASLLFRSSHVPTDTRPAIWEESVRIIEAETESEALKEAERIGAFAIHTYETERGLVIWTFEKVERVYSIQDEELRSGSEVFSRFLRDAEVQSLLEPFEDES